MAVTQADQQVVKFAAAADAITGWNDIAFFWWTGAASAAALLVSDAAGNEIYRDIASVANYRGFFPVNAKLNGITVTTMGSGTLYAIRRSPYSGKY